MKKTIAVLLTIVMMAALLAGCGSNQQPEEFPDEEELPVNAEWSVYIYMCGSDLETKSGYATDNLAEINTEIIPANVNVVVQTGGAKVWNNDVMDPDYIQRWHVDNTGFHLDDNMESASMGDAGTLQSFLQYANDNYPAEKTMLVFWNHGGGTCYGVCFDELYDNDALTLIDLRNALTAVFGKEEGKPRLSIVGFDACLMSTVDTLDVMSEVADYMIASEEVEPGEGWNYNQTLEAICENPEIGPEELGKAVCDSYLAKQMNAGRDDEATLALIDLSKTDKLISDFDSFGAEVLADVFSNPDRYTDITVKAVATENFGGNSRAQGYSNLVDLRDFAAHLSDAYPSAAKMIETIDDCVLYSVHGDRKEDSGGISFYYQYNNNLTGFEKYSDVAAGHAFRSLYSIGLNGNVSEADESFISDLGLDPENLPVIKTFAHLDPALVDPANVKLDNNKEGRIYADFGPEVGSCTIEAMMDVFVVNDDGSFYKYIGSDDELTPDWNEGIFIENISGKWGYLDGNLVFMELTDEDEDFHIYSIPIYYQGELVFLQEAYDFATGEWEALGVRNVGDEAGMVSSYYLDEGEEIELADYWEDDGGAGFEPNGIKLEYRDDLFSYGPLPDGKYKMWFIIEDVFKNHARSQAFGFTMVNGEIA